MPQLDPSSFPSQLFWLTVSFVVFFLLMWKLALPRVASVLQKREEKIMSDLDRAQAFKSQAAEVMAAYDRALAVAREEAAVITRQATGEMATQAAKKIEEMTAAVAKQIQAAEGRIAATRTEALNQVREVAGEATKLAVAKLIGAEPSSDRVDNAVGNVLAEHNR
jgi:F-type H+-transporting ATPase subunit b